MSRRALVVDDEPIVCQQISTILVSVGMNALTLCRSSEAPQILDEGIFDVVFLDLHMPSPDGIELARHMRATPYNRTTPIIMLSDDQRPSALSVGFAAGANFFLYKPIDKNRLLKLVRATQGTLEAERRRTRRVPIHSHVRLRYGLEELEGETVDISMSGLLLRAPRVAPLGANLRLTLELSHRSQPLVTSGSVVRIQGLDRMGIKLDQLSQPDSERLQEFLLQSLTPA